MKKIILSMFVVAVFAACGIDATPSGEDHGNIVGGEEGIILTVEEHPTGWGEANCLICHSTGNIHLIDRTGTDLDLEEVRELTESEGVSSCSQCHGDNGVQ